MCKATNKANKNKLSACHGVKLECKTERGQEGEGRVEEEEEKGRGRKGGKRGWKGVRGKGRMREEVGDFRQIKRKERGERKQEHLLYAHQSPGRELNACLELLELFAPQTDKQWWALLFLRRSFQL